MGLLISHSKTWIIFSFQNFEYSFLEDLQISPRIFWLLLISSVWFWWKLYCAEIYYCRTFGSSKKSQIVSEMARKYFHGNLLMFSNGKFLDDYVLSFHGFFYQNSLFCWKSTKTKSLEDKFKQNWSKLITFRIMSAPATK